MILHEANKLNLKTSILTIADMFDIEKLEKKNPDLFKELCEKYPLKGEKIYVLQCVKGERIKMETESKEKAKEEVLETPSVSQDAQETAPVEAPAVERVVNINGGAYIEHVEEMNIVEGEDHSQLNDEAVEESKEEASNDFPEDFQPLYKASEHITIKYDYDQVIEKLTILTPILETDDKKNPVNYKYKVVVDGVGIKHYDEQFLVDHEVQ